MRRSAEVGYWIHENCYRRPHFDAGRFATEFGDEDTAKGYYLQHKARLQGPGDLQQLPESPIQQRRRRRLADWCRPSLFLAVRNRGPVSTRHRSVCRT